MSGSSAKQAVEQLAAMEQKAKPPYLFVGYGPLGKPNGGKRRAKLSAAPKHMALLEVYREFRRLVHSGRFTILAGCKIDAVGGPREVLAFDSQLVEKAHALPLGGLSAGPAQPDRN